MFKKYMIIPILLSVLGIAFVLVSFLVYISRGKYFFIKQKLRIGALILTLTAFSCSCQSNQDDIIMCYDTAAPIPHITFLNDIDQNQQIIVDPLVNRSIKGTIEEEIESYPDYSFRIVDANGTTLQKGELPVSKTGVNKNQTLSFEILIDQDIPLGIYMLWVYNFDLKTQDQNPDSYFCSSSFQIIESMILCYEMVF